MRRLGDLAAVELGDRPLTLVVPLGSTEQHGPHLPLDTDTRIAVAIAGRVVDRLDDAVLGPAIAIGAAGEHAGFPGTLSVGTDALADQLIELRRSLGPEFARLVIVNGHGGNADALRRAGARSAHDGRPFVAWSIAVTDGDAHAGETETSLMLAIDPTAVRTDAVAPGDRRALAETLPAMREGGVAAVSANGVLGDPTTARADTGRRLLRELVDDAMRAIVNG